MQEGNHQPGVPDFAIFCLWTTTLCSRIEMLKWVVSQGRSLVLMATPRLRIRIILANGAILGPTKIAVLEAIEATGSIHAAARSLGFSYRYVWRSVQSVNGMLCSPAVCDGSGWLQAGWSKTHSHWKASCCNLPRNRKPSAYCVLSRTPSTRHNVTKASAVDRSCRTG